MKSFYKYSQFENKVHPRFSGVCFVSIISFSVWCFVDHCLSFCPFSFGHFVFCPFSISGFRLYPFSTVKLFIRKTEWGQPRMNNPDTQGTLDTRHKTKQIKNQTKQKQKKTPNKQAKHNISKYWKLKRWETRTLLKGWTHVLAKDYQLLFLINRP